MTDSPQVSVVMPFLDAGSFIAESIESVRSQTFSDWELLLCDDGSKDGSTAIAREYAARFPDLIRYLEHRNHRNRGASAARNLGLSAARGEFVAFLDADDVWLPNKLEEQVPILRARPEAAMMYEDTQLWFGWTGAAEDLRRDHVPSYGLEKNRLYAPPSLIVPYFLRRSVLTPCTCSVLVRREVALDVGGFEESFRTIYTDQAFYAKLCLIGSVLFAEGCRSRYRQHRGSAYQTGRRTGRRYPARRAFLKWLERQIANSGVADDEIERELRAELRRYRVPATIKPLYDGLTGKTRKARETVRELRRRLAGRRRPR